MQPRSRHWQLSYCFGLLYFTHLQISQFTTKFISDNHSLWGNVVGVRQISLIQVHGSQSADTWETAKHCYPCTGLTQFSTKCRSIDLSSCWRRETKNLEKITRENITTEKSPEKQITLENDVVTQARLFLVNKRM